MEMIKTNAFCEMTTEEMQITDGGIVIFGITVTLTVGAKIGLGLFGAGSLIGIAYGIWG